MLEAVFDDWAQQAGAIFKASAECPLIDDCTIDMSDELVECWTSASFDDGERVSSFLHDRLIATGNAPNVRFVALNFLFRLVHFEGIEQEWAVQNTRASLAERFAGTVQFMDIPALEDPKLIRWEIVNFCAIRDWAHASDLCGRLNELGAVSQQEYRALLGQMYLWSVVTARAKRDDPLEFLTWWRPELDQSWDLRSYELFSWAMELSGDVEYSESEKEGLSDAAHYWDLAFESIPTLHPSYIAAQAKCDFLKGNHLRAAQHYRALLDQKSDTDQNFELVVRFKAFSNAAECYRRGGDTEAAMRLLEQCTEQFPKAKGLWLQLATLYMSSPLDADVQKVQECLRREEEIDPAFGEDPRASIALALGEITPNNFRTFLRKAVESNSDDFRFMDSVVSRHWPEFQSLEQESREEWVSAARFLWATGGPQRIRALLRRKVAGVFADIAEAHLKRVFDRFRRDRGVAVLQGVRPELRKEKFVKYLEGAHLGLGEMIYEITATRRLPEPPYPDFKSWLARDGPWLKEGWNPDQARRLNELRRRCSHSGGAISEEEGVELYDLCVWLISLSSPK